MKHQTEKGVCDMCDSDIIQRLLETNENMQHSNDRKFLALVLIYLLTVVGFFVYLTMTPISMRLEAKDVVSSEISQSGK